MCEFNMLHTRKNNRLILYFKGDHPAHAIEHPQQQ